jgi:hypothetical protein
MYLPSLDSARLSGFFGCVIREQRVLPGDCHAPVASCDPPALGQDAGYPLGIDEVLSGNRFTGDDLWHPGSFPIFVSTCAPNGPGASADEPQVPAWGELSRTAQDARDPRFHSDE